MAVPRISAGLLQMHIPRQILSLRLRPSPGTVRAVCAESEGPLLALLFVNIQQQLTVVPFTYDPF